MVELSRVDDHAVKLLSAICIVGTYSHHYAYSAHMNAAACMPRYSGVLAANKGGL